MTDDERQGLLMSDFVQVPNLILQMQRVLKNGNTYACLQFIWCKTGGWGRNADTIAYSQFINDKRYGTGLGEKTIRRSVEKLAELGVISMAPSFNNMHEFTLNIEKIRELVGDEAWSKRPPLEDTSMVNLTTSPVILTERVVNLSDKHGQSDHHTRTTTQEPLHKNITQEEKPKKSKDKFDALSYPIPSFIEQENWNDFVAMRKEIKKPLTAISSKRTINALVKFDANGFDANDSLDYSIANNYPGVFERSRKQQSNNQVNRHATKQPQADCYANRIDAQLAAENELRMRTVNQGEYS
ncbi:hypothetical protein [Psychrobacter sp. JB193]|uniref:hypothetical protein n=1 Tax=Psychrobacter sp. JB193 TaxID=2024406 RepID=UPI000BAAD215|nr:hypothetical protein [Psychrobacter sp. JB193]PAT63957.1 hypothetical protein CIK80_02265 [Psychrobacter sp. JB193]